MEEFESNFQFHKSERHAEFKNMVLKFAISCMREKPPDIIDYAANYFTNLEEKSSMGSDIISYKQSNNQFRRPTIFAEKFDPAEDDFDLCSISTANTEEKSFHRCLKNCLLFQNLDTRQFLHVISSMNLVVVKAGDVVINQGEEGDYFYVIETGEFEASSNGKVVNIYKNEGSFGELALMYNTPRAATIKALTDGKLWSLSRQMFRKIVLKAAYERRQLYDNFLTSAPILQALSDYEKMVLSDALVQMKFMDGEYIIEEDKPAQGMFFVESGTVKVIKHGTPMRLLHEGEYFGELALLTKDKRAASVIAVGEVLVAFIDTDGFERLLGPCKDFMKRHIESYDNT